MHYFWIILIVVLSLILAVSIFALIYVTRIMFVSFTRPKCCTREWQTEYFRGQGRPSYDYLEREPFELTLRDGYLIHGDIVINDPHKFMILCHGHGSTREGTLKYADIYYKLGYSIVMYDHRGHGDNVRVPCLMGYNESQDLVEIIHYVKNRFGDIVLGLHGTSLGGATVLMSTKYQQEANFIIADCPYSSIKAFAGDFIKKHKAPKFPFLTSLNLCFKAKYKISLKDMDVATSIKNNEIPTLFLHGAKDTLIPPYHSDILFNSNKGIKEQHIFPNGTHGESVFCDPKEYVETVTSFVKRYEK